MRLPIFLLSLVIAVVAAVALGAAAGFGSGLLVLFVIAVVVFVQLAYVGFIALLAAERKQETSRRNMARPTVHSTGASPENDR